MFTSSQWFLRSSTFAAVLHGARLPQMILFAPNDLQLQRRRKHFVQRSTGGSKLFCIELLGDFRRVGLAANPK